MSHVPNDLHDSFPGDRPLLHSLKLSDPHFQRLATRYYEVNRAIHRIETEVEPASDSYLETLKKERLGLLDEIAQILARARIRG
ncbi:YdcH family protein [Novosphingobium piscinae]|uniref:YdcH family protein n=1 Tax=Novosphingobium piscinae TaxID=1507448 RepID=A0A7X1FYW1_9SPHN|nr:YdcH family protein [Novosphingobium piscinae]MBC2669513.1 YdcH family protein [Novosphingobium piscinae]